MMTPAQKSKLKGKHKDLIAFTEAVHEAGQELKAVGRVNVYVYATEGPNIEITLIEGNQVSKDATKVISTLAKANKAVDIQWAKDRAVISLAKKKERNE